MPKNYVVYVNSEPEKEFPYTVDGLRKALIAADELIPPFRLDVVSVKNPDEIDLDNPSGLTRYEKEVVNAWGYDGYV